VPRYPVADWNLYARSSKEESRSNNISEGGNHGFNSLLARVKPDLWSLLIVMRDYLRNQDFEQEQRKAGIGKEPKTGLKWANQLRRVLGRWNTDHYANHLEYLHAVATNLDF
jgi:hypothetical protein